jgi:hypothetical protein
MRQVFARPRRLRYQPLVDRGGAPTEVDGDAVLAAGGWLGLPVEVAVARATLRVSLREGPAPSGPAAAAVLRAERGACWLVGDAAVARALAQRVLGGPDEDPAPRWPTFEERATWAAVVALIVDRAGLAVTVEPAEVAPASAGVAWIALALELDGAWLGAAWVGVPAGLAQPVPAWGGALIATRTELAALRVGDVLVLGDPEALDAPLGDDEVRVELAVAEQTWAPTGALLELSAWPAAAAVVGHGDLELRAGRSGVGTAS